MLKIDRILLPVDFQDAGKPVVHQAATLARHFHSEVVLLHAVTPLSYSAGMLEGTYVPANLADLQAELLRQAQKHMDGFLLPELESITLKRVLLEGDPASAIVETAREKKADLIMMPTHGYGAFRRFLLGSVTAKVLHDTELPVWTGGHVGGAAPSDFAIRHVLCAVDLSAHSSKTAQRAAELAGEFNARCTLVHVTAGMEPYGPGDYVVEPAWSEALAAAAAKKIAKLQQDAGINAEVIIESGDGARLLMRTAERTHADVLVIGRPSGGRLRTTGYGIIRDSHIPVLSV
jgi:nucleotide-binding universal stress UspA family protein